MTNSTTLLALAVLLALLAPAAVASPQDAEFAGSSEVHETFAVLPERERAAAVNRMLRDRLDHLLPTLMRETGIDLWLVINREYVEDPVYLTLVPAPAFAARRTTMLVLHDRGGDLGIERLTVSRYGLGDFYESAWDGGDDDSQWDRLAEVIRERSPQRIGVNTSEHWAFGDGLSSGLRARLERELDDELRARLTSAEALCIRWLETRTELELEVYPSLCHIARSVIREGFSNAVITPGITTTDDVAWFLRQRFTDLGLPVWFMPYCNLQRQGLVPEDGAFWGEEHQVIRRGDVLHTDVGIHYLRLNTDTQEMAYVLRPGETEAPEGLRAALAVGNRWQDELTGSFRLGRSGNEILKMTRDRASAAGIVCSVYTHPLGFFGHAAGPTIGMWDNQGATPIRGDWPLHANTCYAIEGNVLVPVPEWDDQPLQIKLEQDAWFDGDTVRYIGGRQTNWILIR